MGIVSDMKNTLSKMTLAVSGVALAFSLSACAGGNGMVYSTDEPTSDTTTSSEALPEAQDETEDSAANATGVTSEDESKDDSSGDADTKYKGDVSAKQALGELKDIDVTTDKEIAKAIKDGDLPKYDRTGQFGSAWLDVDKNGCDTRNDILTRDVRDATIDDNCKVKAGTLDEPYTGKTVEFKPGQSTQIDHKVPLSYGQQHGAMKESRDWRVNYANDPKNLIATDGAANRCRSDSLIVAKVSEKSFEKNETSGCDYEKSDVVKHEDGSYYTVYPWITNDSDKFKCEYTADLVHLVHDYGFSITDLDADAAKEILTSC